MQQLKQGTLLQGGKYRIEKVLGQGGFGITYLAVQEMLDRKVCLKEFFYKEYCERDEETSHVTLGTQSNHELVERFLNKFLKEARTISQLDHPNIIHIHDIFRENNTAYYVMDYIEGESLAEKVKNEGALHETIATDYIKQVASALDFIHKQSINHLDVKPANIMVRKADNRAILIDFGLSKQYDAQGGQTSTTPVGISHGYAPMEQYNAGGVSTFSPQTDIYSLGATLYKLVTGITPPQASDVLNDGLPELPAHISTAVKDTITATMQVRKKDRPADINTALSLLKEGAYSNLDNRAKETENKTATKNEQTDEETKIITSSPKETPKKTKETSSQSKPDEAKTIFWKNPIVRIVIGCVIFSILFLIFNNKNYIGNSIDTNSNYSSNTSYVAVDTVVADSTIVYVDNYEKVKIDENSHEWVDLGLSVKWATCNVGASSPSDYGNYYAWGVSTPNQLYDIKENYTLPDIYDTANQLWGSQWRMPTVDEFYELIKKCRWEWIAIEEHCGYKVTGPNGNCIFIPAAGSTAADYNQRGVDGLYWSSSVRKGGAFEEPTNFYHHKNLRFNSVGKTLSYGYGPQVRMSIRPVTK